MSDRQKKSKYVRCAIYTRKSTHEGLEQEFNSLHAQREACESYISSQKHAGWRLIQTNYDDGGFTGGNIERPALQQLLEDIHNGAIDCVVVYKVDRLSRSLLDFARMMQLFEKKDIGFISVTQNFDTTTSMGRLTLNILLSFAQFEREMISERTRDKLAAMRKKGKWLGGRPVLGYDVDVSNNHLTVNPKEKELVTTIFKTYLETESTKATAEQLNRQGLKTKTWKKKNGEIQRGKPFTATSVQSVLRNPTYIGKSRYKGELYDGEHEAIIEIEVFDQVAAILNRNRREKDTRNRSDQVYLLK